MLKALESSDPRHHSLIRRKGFRDWPPQVVSYSCVAVKQQAVAIASLNIWSIQELLSDGTLIRLSPLLPTY
jgi:hypothetical protein